MKKWMLLILLSLSMFIIVIDTTVMNVSISALVVDLNTTVVGIQSAISLYALVMASFMLIGSALAGFLGKKLTFLIGVVIFGVGTFFASLSSTLLTLIIGWSILEGLGSSLMVPNIQTLLRDRYGGKDLAFAYGIISAVSAVGAALGPILGWYLTTFHSWRWAFRLEVLIVLVVLALSYHIENDRPAHRPRFDLLGAILSVLGFSTVVLSIFDGATLWGLVGKAAFSGREAGDRTLWPIHCALYVWGRHSGANAADFMGMAPGECRGKWSLQTISI